MINTSLQRESASTHSNGIDGISASGFGERIVMLSVPQQSALEWLLTGGSVTEAAQVAGVTRQTVSKWLNDDEDFRTEYERWKQQSLAVAHARMVAMAEAAVDNLSAAIRERHDLRASEFLLKQVTAVGKK